MNEIEYKVFTNLTDNSIMEQVTTNKEKEMEAVALELRVEHSDQDENSFWVFLGDHFIGKYTPSGIQELTNFDIFHTSAVQKYLSNMVAQMVEEAS